MLFLKIKSQLLIFMKETTSVSFVQTLRVSLILIPANPTTDPSKQYKQQYVLLRNLTIHTQRLHAFAFSSQGLKLPIMRTSPLRSWKSPSGCTAHTLLSKSHPILLPVYRYFAPPLDVLMYILMVLLAMQVYHARS